MAESEQVDAEIRVLRSQYEELARQITGIGTKMDTLIEKWDSIARLQEQMSQQNAGLTQAYRQIESCRRDHEEEAKTMWRSIRNVDKEQKQWLNRLIGAAAVATVLLGGVQYFIFKDLNRIDENQKAILSIERRIIFLEQPGSDIGVQP